MTWLFDVNVLLAIADSSHVFHGAIHSWLQNHAGTVWASCPITENGFVRVLCQPAYRGSRVGAAEAVEMLREMKRARGRTHVFWPDEISLTDAAVVRAERLAGHGQISDVYLAALAHARGGRLVTFDSGVPWQAVAGARAGLLEIPKT